MKKEVPALCLKIEFLKLFPVDQGKLISHPCANTCRWDSYVCLPGLFTMKLVKYIKLRYFLSVPPFEIHSGDVFSNSNYRKSEQSEEEL